MSSKEREEAEAERHRWLTLSAPDPLSLKADDGAFAVEPLLWRTAALRDLAPWSAPPPGASSLQRPWTTLFDLGELRAKGYVRPPFLPKAAPAWHEGDGPREPSLGERLIGLRAFFLRAFLAALGMPDHADWARDAQDHLAQRWLHLGRLHGALNEMLWVMDEHGLEIWATFATDELGIPTDRRRLRRGHDVDVLLAIGMLGHHPRVDLTLRGFLADLERGRTVIGAIGHLTALAYQGLSIEAEGPDRLRAAFRVLQPVLGERRATVTAMPVPR